MYCSQCGAPLAAGVQFCAACGAPAASGTTLPERVRPAVVTLLAVLKFIVGFAWLAVSLVCVVTAGRSTESLVPLLLAVFFFVLGTFAVVGGYGLWTLRRYGRFIQMAYSFVGLLGFPLQTLISVLILIYMFKPGVRILFSGKPVEQLTRDEQGHLRALSSSSTAAVVVGIAVAALVMVSFTGLMAAIAIPNLLNAIDRGKQKRTMADLRSIATAVEAYATDVNAYPSAASAAELRPFLEPTYIKTMPVLDGWSNAFEVESSATGYTLYSHGKDGVGGNCDQGETALYNDEICFVDGRFTRYPQGMVH